MDFRVDPDFNEFVWISMHCFLCIGYGFYGIFLDFYGPVWIFTVCLDDFGLVRISRVDPDFFITIRASPRNLDQTLKI